MKVFLTASREAAKPFEFERQLALALARCAEAQMDAGLAAEVDPDWRPQLNHEHDDHRWVAQSQVSSQFVWPGQKCACAEILSELIPEGSLSAGRLQIEIGSRQAGG